jgi:hypothetical protein
MTMNNSLPKMSNTASASDPSEEFSWTWIQFSPEYDHGMWYSTEKDAEDAALDNYHHFGPTMKQSVLIIKAYKGWNL